MGLNIVCTSKPCDGLFYYSYEYCDKLAELGVDVRLIVITRGKFTPQDYIDSIKEKYIDRSTIDRVYFNDFVPEVDDISMIMGRSMITIPYREIHRYDEDQVFTLRSLFENKLIAVYSENHQNDYEPALEYFDTLETYDLCDHDVYRNGVGDHFEKTINFSIYAEPVQNVQYEHCFLGTSREYYATVDQLVSSYNNSCIITYNDDFVNPKNENIFAPVKNLLGLFNTYVYTKEAFDPAPRLIQECKYFGKNVIYQRDKNIVDGGSVYYKRDIIEPDVGPILKAIKELS